MLGVWDQGRLVELEVDSMAVAHVVKTGVTDSAFGDLFCEEYW
ncbi:hypothetical protein L195_g013463 [Trifolium pratense]|uniref:Uncharacterized protein n=1 Tax=Trifolium pratense TaxID=57577 RepID=A0A2K3PN84_TRIPR|nr:hypothetical protein L195_g013463 [Trifolium pratense]